MTSDERPTPAAPATAPAVCPVADTMRRVHAELRAGRAPSYEALLAYGVPAASSAA